MTASPSPASPHPSTQSTQSTQSPEIPEIPQRNAMAEPKTTAGPTETDVTDEPVKNTADLDDISLAQALLDFDVANARVIDLTKRLTVLTKELRDTTTLLQKTKLRHAHVSAELKQIKASRAFRTAGNAQRALGAVRSRLGR